MQICNNKKPNKNKKEKKVFLIGNSPELYKFTSTKALSTKIAQSQITFLKT